MNRYPRRKKRTVDETEQLNSAAYAADGIPVFPCHGIVPLKNECTCYGKREDCKPGKHPRINAWPKKATTDPKQILKWWGTSGWGNSNIGVVAGRVVFIDIDPRNDGVEKLIALEADYGNLPRQWVARSGGKDKGEHIYLSVPEGYRIPKSERWTKDGVEIKGEGSYVIGVGSIHEHGNRYEWISKEGKIPPVIPDKWLEVLGIDAQSEEVDSADPVIPETDGVHKAYSRNSNSKANKPEAEEKSYTDNTHNTNNSEYLSVLSVSSSTRMQIWEAIQATVPTQKGIRNERLCKLARFLYRIDEIQDWDAAKLEPVIRCWLNIAVSHIGPRNWDATWGEWLYIWGSWVNRSIDDTKQFGAFKRAMQKEYPPMPETYKRSESLKKLVALCSEMHKTAADDEGVWFVSCRDAAIMLGIPQHFKTVASWFRLLVKDGILIKAEEHKKGSLQAQRYRYIEWKESNVAGAQQDQTQEAAA